MHTSRARSALFSLVALAAGCATLADAETGGSNLPNAAAGPFRALHAGELGNLRSAPNALTDDVTFPRDPSVIDADGDPGTLEVFGYFAVTPEIEGQEPDPAAPPRAIVRYGALDGRSFDRKPITVLEPEAAWEGASIGAPSALRVGAEIFLYYAADGGIGLARSTDGATFTRAGENPVLGPAASGWESGATPKSPGVVRLDDGSFRMFYEIPGLPGEGGIGEARSDDGVAWTRVGSAAVLAPTPAANPEDPPPDDVSVGAPFPVLTRSAEGRAILRVYYAARDSLDHAVIALAARFDPASGELFRAASPVFGSGSSLGPREPCVLVTSSYALLFVTQLAGRTKSAKYPAVAAGVAPADASLPKPEPP